MNAPAQRMEVPTDSDAVTYAKADLGETIRVFKEYGVRISSIGVGLCTYSAARATGLRD